jgi:hypothetical protein
MEPGFRFASLGAANHYGAMAYKNTLWKLNDLNGLQIQPDL